VRVDDDRRVKSALKHVKAKERLFSKTNFVFCVCASSSPQSGRIHSERKIGEKRRRRRKRGRVFFKSVNADDEK